MSFTEKIDVLDLLINILKDHEEKLDELITRLETLIDAYADSLPPPTLENVNKALTGSVRRSLKEYLDERRR